MGARVIQLAEIRARRNETAPAPAAFNGAAEFADRFHFWSGASGRRYVHTVYSLIECPELASGSYIFVRRGADGRRIALAIGRTTHDAASLNLAEIRHQGALIGANEVHVHLLAGTAAQSRMVELDLRAGQLDPATTPRVAAECH